MPVPIDRGPPRRLPGRRIAGCLFGLFCTGCGSHSGDSTPAQCTDPSGSYVLSVAPTGQSENVQGTCSASAASQSIVVSFSNGAVSLNGETCLLCSTSSCQMDVICGASVTCPATVVPVSNPATDYVQIVSFDLPLDADASTPNALVELGPSYCGYAGTASAASTAP